MESKSMPQEDEKSPVWKNPLIIVALIGGIFTVLGVLIGNLLPFIINRPIEIPPCSVCVIGEVFAYSQFVKGEFWSWKIPPGTSTTDFTEDCANSSFHGIHLIYGFTGEGNGGVGVHWGKLPGGFDASGFTTLTFWVRGVTGTDKFEVGLKDKSSKEMKIQFVADTVGKKVVMDLNRFTSVNLVSLDNVHFGFNKDHDSGNICIDDIAFGK